MIGENKLPHVVSLLKSKNKSLSDERLNWYLYIIDIVLYRRVGHTVTNLNYIALNRGPCAVLGHSNVFPEVDKIDDGLFSRFELDTICNIDYLFQESVKCFAGYNFDFSYIINPWIKTLDGGKGNGRIIDFRLSLDENSISVDHVDEIESEYNYMNSLFKTTVHQLMNYTKFSSSPIYWENMFLEKMRVIVDKNKNVVAQFFNKYAWVDVQLRLTDLYCAGHFE